MSTKVHVAILGASGYGAGELLRLLTQHPHARVIAAVSHSSPGSAIAKFHPHLRGFYDLAACAKLDLAPLLDADHAVIFSALPHGESGAAIAELLELLDARRDGGRARIVDLSGDLRLRDIAAHQRFYPETPAFETLRPLAVYGMPELAREQIRAARVVANPGCLATAAILAAAPLIDGGFRGTVVIDAKTGSSGSGKALKETTHHPTRHADFRAYKPLAHQHEGEITQAWGDPLAERITLSFVPQSMDVSRGIFATAHLTLPEPTTSAALRAKFASYYANSPFIRIVDDSPTLQDVVGSNFCDLALAARGRHVIAMAALDNLIKGMAGSAIQNMNLMCGLPETCGLWTPSLRPV